uniref:Transmembrane protein 100 n=1 Tax=Sinocyclocheilus grahami TaxID=75366 RepID=A0A672QX46_SINGR
ILSYPNKPNINGNNFHWTMSADHSVLKGSALVNGAELATATGGAEGSCSRCTLPFGVVLLIIGVAVTAVAYSCSTHGSTISILGLLLLTSGLLLLGFSAICRRCRKRRKMDKAWESQTDLVESLRNSFD